jgi:hypothetical protein
MPPLVFQKAVKSQSKLRLAIFGPSGSGKTYSSLRIAKGLGGNIAVIDTERGRASKYADRFDFSVLELPNPDINTYCQAIKAAQDAGFDVLIIDSLTHAWQELKQEVDKIARARYSGNTWAAWSEGNPKQKRFINAFLEFHGHVIATMRSKTEWVTETDERGKTSPVRVGLSPEQGKNIEYEFDLLMEMNTDHVGTIIKDITGKFQDDLLEKPGEDFGRALLAWLMEGAPVIEQKASQDQQGQAESSEGKGQTSGKPATATKTSQPEPTNAGYAFWSQELKDKFWAKANGLLPVSVTLEEFGIEDIDNYTGSQGHAATVLHVIDAGLKRGLTIKQMHTALAVKCMDEVADSVETATAKLESYITAQSNRKQETML